MVEGWTSWHEGLFTSGGGIPEPVCLYSTMFPSHGESDGQLRSTQLRGQSERRNSHVRNVVVKAGVKPGLTTVEKTTKDSKTRINKRWTKKLEEVVPYYSFGLRSGG